MQHNWMTGIQVKRPQLWMIIDHSSVVSAAWLWTRGIPDHVSMTSFYCILFGWWNNEWLELELWRKKTGRGQIA